MWRRSKCWRQLTGDTWTAEPADLPVWLTLGLVTDSYQSVHFGDRSKKCFRPFSDLWPWKAKNKIISSPCQPQTNTSWPKKTCFLTFSHRNAISCRVGARHTVNEEFIEIGRVVLCKPANKQANKHHRKQNLLTLRWRRWLTEPLIPADEWIFIFSD